MMTITDGNNYDNDNDNDNDIYNNNINMCVSFALNVTQK